jgi:hypothetical protein
MRTEHSRLQGEIDSVTQIVSAVVDGNLKVSI